jgi:hypothetical protein
MRFINRREELHQRGVVGKMPEAWVQAGQGIEKSVVGRRPSCCLQDALRWDRKAKPRPQSALDPQPGCCLQDSASGAFGHGVAAAGDYVPLAEGGSGGIASNSPGEPRAICAHSPGRPAGKVSRKRAGAGDNCAGVAAGTKAGCKRVAGDDRGQAERLADRKGNGDHSSGGSGSECDGIILFGTVTKLVLAPACKGIKFASLEGATPIRKSLSGTLTCLRGA